MDSIDDLTSKLGRVSIEKKSKNQKKHNGLTPYQGKRRCFGEYRCEKCGNTWSSGISWANKGQKCLNCLINVYPHHQSPLEPGQASENKPHLTELCEMCKEIGYNCRELSIYRRK